VCGGLKSFLVTCKVFPDFPTTPSTLPTVTPGFPIFHRRVRGREGEEVPETAGAQTAADPQTGPSTETSTAPRVPSSPDIRRRQTRWLRPPPQAPHPTTAQSLPQQRPLQPLRLPPRRQLPWSTCRWPVNRPQMKAPWARSLLQVRRRKKAKIL
jgi:hypothetical protein